MEQLFGILAVWFLWQLAEPYVEAPKWAWYLFILVACLGWELIIGEADRWWLSFGLAGGVVTFGLVTDLFLVATDAAKVAVLRRQTPLR